MMEEYEQARNNAARHIKIADHILNMTYPLVKDPKLLKLVMQNTFMALQETVLMLMHYERKFKRVPPFTENTHLLHLRDVLQRYNMSTGYIHFINEVNEIMENQKRAEVEFVRKNKFVFASKEYDLNVMTTEELKDYITKAKLFMRQAIGVIDNG